MNYERSALPIPTFGNLEMSLHFDMLRISIKLQLCIYFIYSIKTDLLKYITKQRFYYSGNKKGLKDRYIDYLLVHYRPKILIIKHLMELCGAKSNYIIEDVLIIKRLMNEGK